jgi:hypothetical protein
MAFAIGGARGIAEIAAIAFVIVALVYLIRGKPSPPL